MYNELPIYNWDHESVKTLTETHAYYLLQKTQKIMFLDFSNSSQQQKQIQKLYFHVESSK